MIVHCEVCDKELEVEEEKGLCIYFCSTKCERKALKIAKLTGHPIRFVREK